MMKYGRIGPVLRAHRLCFAGMTVELAIVQ